MIVRALSTQFPCTGSRKTTKAYVDEEITENRMNKLALDGENEKEIIDEYFNQETNGEKKK